MRRDADRAFVRTLGKYLVWCTSIARMDSCSGDPADDEDPARQADRAGQTERGCMCGCRCAGGGDLWMLCMWLWLSIST